MLILAGSAVIAYAAIRALIHGPELENLGIGIVVIGFASAANLAVSTWLFRRARETSSPALEGDAAHLRTDAYTSIGVLVGLGLVSVTGAHWLDPVVALVIAVAIVVTGTRITMGSLRVLVDEALPDEDLAVITRAIESFADRGVVGYHQLRTRQAGARRYVDLHVQFVHGTTLEEAHRIGHQLQDRIEDELDGRRRADPPRARGPRAPGRGPPARPAVGSRVLGRRGASRGAPRLEVARRRGCRTLSPVRPE